MPTKIQKEYIETVKKIKTASKENGHKLTYEMIAKELGYNRAYFSQLLNGGSITADHLKKLKLYFKDVLLSPDYKDKYIQILEEQIEHLKKQIKRQK